MATGSDFWRDCSGATSSDGVDYVKLIISHDVDHLSVKEHSEDLVLPKFFGLCGIELLKGNISFGTFGERLSALSREDAWNNLEELIEFDREHGVKSTFFVAVENGLGISYDLPQAEGAINLIKNSGFDLGAHGSHRAWKHKKDEGGGAINEMLVHMLNLITWYFDGVETAQNLSTETILKTREIDGEEVEADAEDMTVLRLDAREGAEVLCESDLITPSYMNYVEIQGTNGSIWTSILDYFPTVVYCKEPRGVYNQGNNFFEYERVDLFEKELRHFVESIENEEKPSLNSIEDSVETLKVIESIR